MKTRIKELRNSQNLTQSEFAERIDMKRNSIAQIETGIRNPSDRTLKAICKEFNVNYSWLKDGTGVMDDPTHDKTDEFYKSFQNLRSEEQELIKALVKYFEKKM